MKNSVNMISAGVLFLLQLVFLFAQHVICFDIFNTGYWYLYLLAVSAAILQFVLLVCIGRTQAARAACIVSVAVYFLVAAAKLLSIVIYCDAMIPAGLDVLCLCLDVFEGIFAFWILKKKGAYV